MEKTCPYCGETKPADAFYVNQGRRCKACFKVRSALDYVQKRDQRRAQNAVWRAANAQSGSPYRERQSVLMKARRAMIRAEVLEHYGGACACCVEREPLFLTIDHINGNGGAHRREIKRFDIAYWLWQRDYPEGFRVLCFNCNTGRYRNKGICPHERTRAIAGIESYTK